MTEYTEGTDALAKSCRGLPLSQALALLSAAGRTPDVKFTGERAAGEDLTPRVLVVRGNTVIAAYFRDGDPKGEGE